MQLPADSWCFTGSAGVGITSSSSSIGVLLLMASIDTTTVNILQSYGSDTPFQGHLALEGVKLCLFALQVLATLFKALKLHGLSSALSLCDFRYLSYDLPTSVLLWTL